jgi:chorismate mutase/prephenate dehydratase
MALEDIRGNIDALDDAILELLEKRADLVSKVALAKKENKLPTYDPERERQILERLVGRAGRFPTDAVRAVYREIMSACLALQEPMRVAYLGPEGTFSHAAARHLFGLAARYVEEPTIEGVFDAVSRGDVIYGVAPIENSSEGSVNHAVDALMEGNVHIRGEYELEVAQCLLSRGTSLSSVERVVSHPQALGQCRLWLAKNLPQAQLVQAPSTAGAVREAIADPRVAAVAGRFAGELYGLPVLRENVQDRADNATRFVMLALEDAPPSGNDKTTISFSLHDGKGALRRVLDIFDQEGINLSSIQSRPSRQKAWEYVFLADLEGHRDDPKLVAALARVQGACPVVKVHGSYPRLTRQP